LIPPALFPTLIPRMLTSSLNLTADLLQKYFEILYFSDTFKGGSQSQDHMAYDLPSIGTTGGILLSSFVLSVRFFPELSFHDDIISYGCFEGIGSQKGAVLTLLRQPA